MKSGQTADTGSMTRFVHQCGAALQFVMSLALLVVLVVSLVG